MKKLIYIFVLMAALPVAAQKKSLGVGVTNPSPNAVLHVESPDNNQGFIMPRLTTTQRNAMSSILNSTDNGLMVYDRDIKNIFIWDGTAWKLTAVTTSNYVITDVNSTAPALSATTSSNQPGGKALSGVQKGTGDAAGSFIVENTTNTNPAVYGENMGAGAGVKGNVTVGAGAAVQGTSAGTGNAGLFENTNTSNVNPTVLITNAGNGNALETEGKVKTGALTATTISAGNVSVGNISAKDVEADAFITTGTVETGTVTATGNVTGAAFIGDGSQLTGVAATNLTLPATLNQANAGLSTAALTITNAGTGNAIETTGNIQAGFYYGDGSNLTNVSVAPFSYPYTISSSSANPTALLEHINTADGTTIVGSNTGGGYAIHGKASGGTAINSAAVYGEQSGTGDAAGVFEITNAASTQPALWAETNGQGSAIYGRQAGTAGSSAFFQLSNASNASDGIFSTTAGTGRAGRFNITNAANSSSSLEASTVGTGNASQFTINNAASTAYAVAGETNGAALGAGVFGNNTGTGFGVFGKSNGTAFGSAAVYGEQTGTGDAAGAFRINNPSSTYSALFGETNGDGASVFGLQLGLGRAGQFQITNPSNTQHALRAYTDGTGRAGFFTIDNVSNSSPAIFVETNGTGPAIQTVGRIEAGQFIGDGSGLTNLPPISLPFSTSLSDPDPIFDLTNSGAGAAISASNTGGTVAISATYSGPSFGGRAITADNTSTTSGFAGVFSNTDAANTFPAIQLHTQGTGPGARVIQSPTSLGSGVDVWMQNTASTQFGVNVDQQGLGKAGSFNINNASNSEPAIQANTNGTASAGYFEKSGSGFNAAIVGFSTGASTGAGGAFLVTNSLGAEAIYGSTNGTGNTLTLDHIGASGNIAEFRNNSSAVATIDKTGTITASAFQGDGSALTNLPALALPYSANVTSATPNSNLLSIVYDDNTAQNVGVAYFENLNPNSAFSTVFASNHGTNSAGYFRQFNTASNSAALRGLTASNTAGGHAVLGSTTGTGGSGGFFEIDNASNNQPALYATTNGSVGQFTGPAILGETATAGTAIMGRATGGASNGVTGIADPATGAGSYAILGQNNGLGTAGVFGINNASNNSVALDVDTYGTGSAGRFIINNAANPNAALYTETDGTGSAGYFGRTGTGFYAAITGEAKGASTGAGGAFLVTNNLGAEAIYGSTNGTGNTLTLDHIGASGNIAEFRNNSSAVATIDKTGTITASAFQGDGSGLTNLPPIALPYTSSVSDAGTLFGITNSGTGSGMSVTLSNTAGSKRGLDVWHQGELGEAAMFNNSNTNNPNPAVFAVTSGTGSSGDFRIFNAASTAYAVKGETNGAALGAGVFGNNIGTGFGVYGKSNGTAFGSAAVYGEQTGTGDASGAFRINNAANNYAALYGETNGTGAGSAAVRGLNIGGGNGAYFRKNGANGNTAAMWADNFGTAGYGGIIQNTDATNPTAALFAESIGTGASIWANKDASTTGNAIEATNQTAAGNAGYFINTNVNTDSASVYVQNNSTKFVAAIKAVGNVIGVHGVTPAATPFGVGVQGEAYSNSFGIGVLGYMKGTVGYAGSFETMNAGNSLEALKAYTMGTGPAGYFYVDNVGSSAAAIQIDNNGSGPAINTTGSIIAGQFVGDGSGLTNLPPMSLPFGTTLSNGSTLFSLTNSGTGSAIHASTTGTAVAIDASTTNGWAALNATNSIADLGFAAELSVTSPSNTYQALKTYTNGLGSAGTFEIINSVNSSPALAASTDGDGVVANFFTSKTANTNATLNVATNGAGPVINAFQDTNGSGNGINVSLSNTVGFKRGIDVNHQGEAGEAAVFINSNAANTNATLFAENNNNTGNGQAISAALTSAGYTAILGQANGTGGHAGKFEITNAGNAYAALQVNTNTNTSAINANTTGSGPAIEANTATGWAAINTYNSGTGHAIRGENSGSGDGIAAFFSNSNAGNTYPAIQAETAGVGPGLRVIQQLTGTGGGVDVNLLNSSNPSNGVVSTTAGTGSAGLFVVNNSGSSNAAIYSETNGTAATIHANTTGTGPAGRFEINNGTTSAPAIVATTNGTGQAIDASVSNAWTAINATNSIADEGFAAELSISSATNTYQALKTYTNGLGSAATFEILNASNGSPSISATTTGTGSAIFSNTTGSGESGTFVITNSGSGAAALRSSTNGTGPSFSANHTGASGDLAHFQVNDVNVARIDRTGKGFFNSGTQTGGADIAEAFEVEGSVSTYEPGDVLVISETTDRTVEKSSSANSRKVVGVYATKPGVLLTEKGIDDDLGNTVPMGVIGVIPTKVCLENGPIKRGDLLVTSSETGKAMKAKPVILEGVEIYPNGAILGKALENYDGTGAGLIKVLVNVK